MSDAATRPVHIVTDSTADIPPELLGGRPLTVVPLIVEIAGRSYRDGVELSRADFLAALRQGHLPRTSQPPIGAFQQVYQDLIARGYDVVAVHIAARLSGTYNASRAAAEAVAPERIRLIDTNTVSMGVGWIALETADLARAGQPREAIAAHAAQRTADQRLYAVLDTLEYLQRGGRIGRAAALLGSALQLKPILEVRHGAVEPLERVRTMRRALDRLSALVAAQCPWDCAAVLHLDAEAAAQEVAARLRAAQPDLEVVVGQIGTVVGTYGGPGLVGVAGLVHPLAAAPGAPA
ncbi:MAG: DegV family protein [Sphaerobacter sp.]|nr:DegV family protein [Sphaerobacter sp.]